jgi:archaellum component FlaD/FlaE
MTEKTLSYWRKNAEEDYMTTPISVLRYIQKLEGEIIKRDLIEVQRQIDKRS